MNDPKLANSRSRPHTKDEMIKMFIDQVWRLARYWDAVESPHGSRVEGFAHSMLVLLDGGGGFPAMNIVPSPHPDDKEFHIEAGENYWPVDRKPLNDDVQLHDVFYEAKRKAKEK